MTDYTTSETWHTADDGEKLYTKTWKPTSTPKARVIFLHGFSDHCNLYGPLFPSLASRGIEVFALDQRGWGRSVKSPKQKGLTGPTSRVLDDIAGVVGRFVPEAGGEMDVPLFLMGHSMGGAETIHFAASPNPAHKQLTRHIRGYLLASPWIRLHPSTAPWRITVAAGRLAARVLPGFQLYNPVDPAHLTPDQSVVDMFKNDELAHDTGTLEGFAGMLDRAASIDSGSLPLLDASTSEGGPGASAIWAAHGTEDKICDFKGTERWMTEDCGVKDRTWRVYEGWLHRTNDQEGEKKEVFAREVAEWIVARA